MTICPGARFQARDRTDVRDNPNPGRVAKAVRSTASSGFRRKISQFGLPHGGGDPAVEDSQSTRGALWQQDSEERHEGGTRDPRRDHVRIPKEIVLIPESAVAEFLADHERVPEKNWLAKGARRGRRGLAHFWNRLHPLNLLDRVGFSHHLSPPFRSSFLPLPPTFRRPVRLHGTRPASGARWAGCPRERSYA